MKKASAMCALSIALSMASICRSAAGTKEDAYSAVERWAKAYTSADVDQVVASYTPDVVLFAGLYQFARGDKPGTLGRFTFVSVKRGEQWLLSHHHSSPRPSGTGR